MNIAHDLEDDTRSVMQTIRTNILPETSDMPYPIHLSQYVVLDDVLWSDASAK